MGDGEAGAGARATVGCTDGWCLHGMPAMLLTGISRRAGRVCVVNAEGGVLLDVFVKQTEPVTDYRTKFSGATGGGEGLGCPETGAGARAGSRACAQRGPCLL